MGILTILTRLLRAIVELTKAIQDAAKIARLKRPGLVFLKLTKEVNEMLFFTLDLPPIGAIDVVTRKLSVKVGSADVINVDLAVGETVPEFSGADNDSVEGSLIDVDDAGNPSEPSNFSYVLTDTIAPPAPGQVGLRVTREE